MSVKDWSTTPSTNATADAASGINFAESQSPGSLNDSMRSLMAVIAADSERSLSGTTGYQELLGGGLLQWGIAGGTGDVGVTFPKVFPSACRCIMASMDSNGALPADTILVAHVDAISATGFTIRKRILNSGVISAAVQGAFWIAIGY